MNGGTWRTPSLVAAPFSMWLQRLASRYGMLPVTFCEPLEELVDAVRRDLELEQALRR